MKVSHILGLNARTQLFSYPFNKAKGRSIATSKIKTKKLLKKSGVPVPKMYAKFLNLNSVSKFDWTALPDSFVLKPSKGLGGEGIVVIKKRLKPSGHPKSKNKYSLFNINYWLG